MSDAGSKPPSKDDQRMAEPRNRRWFWQMWMVNATLWAAPLFVLLTGLVQFRWPAVADPHLADRLMFSLPWVAVAVSAACVAVVLWRIAVNMEGGEQPFREEDGSAYMGAAIIETGMLAAVLLGFLVTLIYGTLTDPAANDKDLWTLVDAFYGPMSAILLLSMFTYVLRRMHIKAREAYEELEKGV